MNKITHLSCQLRQVTSLPTYSWKLDLSGFNIHTGNHASLFTIIFLYTVCMQLALNILQRLFSLYSLLGNGFDMAENKTLWLSRMEMRISLVNVLYFWY